MMPAPAENIPTANGVVSEKSEATPFRVGESPVHGRGVFATRDICAGERLMEYRGRRISAEAAAQIEAQRGSRPIYLFALDDESVLDGDIRDNPAKFLNHSCEENCEVRLEISAESDENLSVDGTLWIYALRDIAEGEELTFDYAFSLTSFWEHPCSCGAKKCVGFIVSRLDRQKLRKLLRRHRK